MSVFIERIKIKNLLSFDEEGIDFELKPLNVLIGANASGKSNFVLAVRILTSLSQYNMREIIEGYGGISEIKSKLSNAGKIEFETKFGGEAENNIVLHNVELNETPLQGNFRFFTISSEELLVRERGSDEAQWLPTNGKGIIFHIQIPEGEEMRYVRNNIPAFMDTDARQLIPVVIDGKPSSLSKSNFADRSRSVVLQGQHESIIHLRDQMTSCFNKGFYPVLGTVFLQSPNEAGVQQDHLDPVGSNLASYIAALDERLIIGDYLLPKLQEVYPDVVKLNTTVKAGRIYITLTEKGYRTVTLQPRISDGILRLIAILSVLYQDDPPPLICLEEPENGFHPDVLRVIAKALREASERTQIIVTTHSPDLLGYMNPEDVVVCERGRKGGTQLSRLSSEVLGEWLKDYDLGELWLKGELGGTRF
jgi:predicted ATPase